MVFDVAAIKIHENYNNHTHFENDYCMIKMATSVDYQAYPHIRPICLPTETTQTYTGFTATVTGWGHTSYQGLGSKTLREVEVTVLSNDACK